MPVQRRRYSGRSRGGRSMGERLQGLGQGLQGLGQSIGTFIYLQEMLKKSRTPEEKAKIQEDLLKMEAKIAMAKETRTGLKQTGADRGESTAAALELEDVGLGGPGRTTTRPVFEGEGAERFSEFGEPALAGVPTREVAEERRLDKLFGDKFLISPEGIDKEKYAAGILDDEATRKGDKAIRIKRAEQVSASGLKKAMFKDIFDLVKDVGLPDKQAFNVANGLSIGGKVGQEMTDYQKFTILLNIEKGKLNASQDEGLEMAMRNALYDLSKASTKKQIKTAEDKIAGVKELQDDRGTGFDFIYDLFLNSLDKEEQWRFKRKKEETEEETEDPMDEVNRLPLSVKKELLKLSLEERRKRLELLLPGIGAKMGLGSPGGEALAPPAIPPGGGPPTTPSISPGLPQGIPSLQRGQSTTTTTTPPGRALAPPPPRR